MLCCVMLHCTMSYYVLLFNVMSYPSPTNLKSEEQSQGVVTNNIDILAG